MDKITKKDLKEMIILSYKRVEKDKEKINKINVFPVPDQDTGGNLAKTLLGVKKAIEGRDFEDLDALAGAALDGALEAAQGNAGVIYAGFLAGFLPSFQNKNPIGAEKLARAMKDGARVARNSIHDPKDGTILDVIDAAAETIEKESTKDTNLISLFKKAVKDANEALLATRDKMEIFRKANVVDAGGLGYLMILESYVEALEGRENTSDRKSEEQASEKVRKFVQTISFRYEVVFLIKNPKFSREELSKKLSEIGDSIEILEIKNRTKVHIHTDDPDGVKKIAREAGEIQNLRVEDMTKEIAGEKSVKENSVGIVVEQTCDMPEKIIEKYQLGFVRHILDWPAGEKLKGENVYEKMREADEKGIKEMPKTAQASPKAFIDEYKKMIEKLPRDGKILATVVSSKLSGAYNSAYQGSQLSGSSSNFFIFDSLQVSSSLGLLNLRAIELVQEKRDFDEIIKELKEAIPKSQLFGVLEDPKWLESGGRMSHSQANLVRKMKKIGVQVLITVKDGKIDKGGIVFGAKDLSTAIFKKIKSASAEDRKKGKKIRVVINHCGNEKEAEKLREMLKEIKAEVPYINLVSPVIGAHVGPGSLLAAWMALD